MALVFLVILFSISCGEMLNVFSSMSAKIGFASQKRGALAVAAKVRTGTITSSPGPMFSARMARCKAAVQLLEDIQYLTPT